MLLYTWTSVWRGASGERPLSVPYVSLAALSGAALFRYTDAMQRRDFETLVAEGYERLPERIRKQIDNVALLVEDEPSDEDREAQGLADDETLLGLYKGLPLSARGDMYGIGATLPDTITLYQFPIEGAAAEDGMDVRDVIAETIWHEFAHHFGMDEAEVQAWEQEHFGHTHAH